MNDTTDSNIKQEIQAKGLNAARVRPADLEAEIASEHFFTIGDAAGVPTSMPSPLHLITIGVLVLKNGFTVIGKSACVSRENFDADIGRKIARDDAMKNLWPLVAFRLCDKLAAEAAIEATDGPVE